MSVRWKRSKIRNASGVSIELTQLLVVPLPMLPLTQTACYPAFRVGTAVVGLLFSASWLLERTTLTDSDPFEGVQLWLVGHPLLVAEAVAALAGIARLLAPRPVQAVSQAT
ncbi:hypothetical protein OG985_31630 [Streptomyces sp. NBC_00289]|uniref:hypothetical protein n=1 Tax=Streptomyces sp. NBC_00289 TaxID=2975703 RepID=UPI00324CDF58